MKLFNWIAGNEEEKIEFSKDNVLSIDELSHIRGGSGGEDGGLVIEE